MNTLDVAKSYKLSNVVITTYKEKRQLSYQRFGTTATSVANLGNTCKTSINDGTRTLENVSLLGVQQLTIYVACQKCNAKVTAQTDNWNLGVCTKCSTTKLMDKAPSKAAASVLIQPELQFTPITVRAFDTVLYKLAHLPKVSYKQLNEATLLSTNNFDATVDEQHTLVDVKLL